MRNLLVFILCSYILILPPSGSSQSDVLTMRQGDSFIHSIEFLSGGKRLVSASLDGTVVMWESATGKQIWRLDLDEVKTKNKHTISQLYHMDLSPDGKFIAISYDRTSVLDGVLQSDRKEEIVLIDAETGRLTKSIVLKTGNLAFSPDSAFLVTVGLDSTARFWNVISGTETKQINLSCVSGTPLFTPSGDQLIIANRLEWNSDKPMISIYDLKTGKVIRDLPKEYVEITGIALSHDGKYLAVGGFSGGIFSLKVWGIKGQNEGKPIDLLTKVEKLGNNVVFSPDDRLLASSGFLNGRQMVVVRTISTNKIVKQIHVTSNVRSLAFSPDQKNLAIGTSNGEILLKSL